MRIRYKFERTGKRERRTPFRGIVGTAFLKGPSGDVLHTGDVRGRTEISLDRAYWRGLAVVERHKRPHELFSSVGVALPHQHYWKGMFVEMAAPPVE